jgi:hypothetical protein
MEVDDDNNADDYEPESSLIIPIHSSDLFLEIFADELPSISVLRQILKDEHCGGTIFADAATLYMQTKKPRDCVTLLEDANELEASSKEEKVRVLAASGIAILQLDDSVSNKNADEIFTQAGKIDTFAPMTWMGRGLLNLTKQKLDQAKFFFLTTLKQCGPVLPALLGMAAVLYNEADCVGAIVRF